MRKPPYLLNKSSLRPLCGRIVKPLAARSVLDGDTLAVGAPFANVGDKEGQGEVVIFTREDGNSWREVKRITAEDGNATDGFGSAVALDGDTLVAGAIFAEGNGQTNQGAAYIFARNQGGPNNWGQVTKLTGSLDDRFDNFGSALAVHGDEIFVASPNQGNEQTGMVYHFRRNEGGSKGWGETQQLFDDERRPSDNFGTALAFDGVLLVVGSSRTDVSGLHENDGAAFVFLESIPNSGVWQQVDKLTASDAEGNARFGATVTFWNDLIVVAAPAADKSDSELSVGKVYRFARNANDFSEVAKLTGSDAGAVANFGRAFGGLCRRPDCQFQCRQWHTLYFHPIQW